MLSSSQLDAAKKKNDSTKTSALEIELATVCTVPILCFHIASSYTISKHSVHDWQSRATCISFQYIWLVLSLQLPSPYKVQSRDRDSYVAVKALDEVYLAPDSNRLLVSLTSPPVPSLVQQTSLQDHLAASVEGQTQKLELYKVSLRNAVGAHLVPQGFIQEFKFGGGGGGGGENSEVWC